MLPSFEGNSNAISPYSLEECNSNFFAPRNRNNALKNYTDRTLSMVQLELIHLQLYMVRDIDLSCCCLYPFLEVSTHVHEFTLEQAA